MQIQMSTSKLRNGMRIAKDVYLNNGLVLIPAGATVDSNVLSLLTRHFIDKVTVDFAEEKEEPVVEWKEREEKHKEEFKQSFQIAEEDVEASFDKIIFRNESVKPNELLDILNRVIAKSDNALDLQSMLYTMQQTSSGVYSHSITTALIAQQLGKWLGVKGDELQFIGLAGLLHDIGMLRLPAELINKDERSLTSSDEALLQRHAVLGYHLLKDKGLDSHIVKTVLTHHERMDGSGYPLRVRGNNIIKLARLIAIADTYDKMTTSQPGKEALNPFSVAVYFENEAYTKFDTAIQLVFLRNMLEGFVSHDVILNNDRRGQIVFINKFNLSSPMVKCGSKVYDLSIRKDIWIKQVLS